MNLTVDIGDDGSVKVSIGGMVIGMVKALDIKVDERTHPVPHIRITMMDVKSMVPSEFKVQCLRALHNYKAALASHPLVRVLDYRDTLPEGMPAVTLEEDE
jgi:hypothetical protein